ncbi:MAG: phosphodiester glycosidase family protein [Lachnospiraceae bacterium]|nr:phosphodiester glycosidase family protein [Lachnospiraceae bacterium]
MEDAMPSLDAGHVLALYILAAIAVVSVIFWFFLFIKKRIRPVMGTLSVILAMAVLLLCVFYPSVELLYAHPNGDPGEKVGAFLNAVSEGRLADGYDVLYGASGADASGVLNDEISEMYYRLLADNFAYEYTGEMVVRDLDAYIPVRMSYANLPGTAGRVREIFDAELENIVQTHPRREVYKEDDSYEEWVIEDAYHTASERALSEKPPVLSRDLVIRLSYYDGAWNIIPSDELLYVLGGGVCGNPTSLRNISEKVELYANNAKSVILSDLVYIPKLYSIPENAIAGYEPCDDKYFELEDPNMIYEVAADSSHLIGDADLIFDPNVTFAPGQPIYYYADDSIFAVVWKEFCNNCYCNFAEVFISDPSQLRRKIAGNTFGYSAQMYASSLAAEANAVVAMNGDFYKFRSLGLCVYDRQVYRCESASLDSCFFTADGRMLFSYAGELTDKDEAQRFVDENDVLFSLSFGPVLIDNGVPKENLAYRIGETMQMYSRSAIGQIEPNHYLLMTIGHVYPYRECCTLRGAQDIMMLKGCINAYTLDGGQTAELIWRDRPYSYVDWGVERTVSDIIYFATAVPENEQ